MDERTQLKSLAASRSLPHALVCQARVVLWSAEGQSNTENAERLGWAKATVGKRRQRFLEQRVAGLYDELRPGRPRSIADEQIAVLLKRTLSRKPAGATHWSVRQAAHDSGISKSTVHRVFQTFALQPHRSRSFKLSTDPFFITTLAKKATPVEHQVGVDSVPSCHSRHRSSRQHRLLHDVALFGNVTPMPLFLFDLRHH